MKQAFEQSPIQGNRRKVIIIQKKEDVSEVEGEKTWKKSTPAADDFKQNANVNEDHPKENIGVANKSREHLGARLLNPKPENWQLASYNFNMLHASYVSLVHQMQAMQARLNEMEKRLYDMNQKEEPESIENGKKRRRRAGEIVKNFHCMQCGKSYGSDMSLNLHARLKHSGQAGISHEPEKQQKRIQKSQIKEGLSQMSVVSELSKLILSKDGEDVKGDGK